MDDLGVICCVDYFAAHAISEGIGERNDEDSVSISTASLQYMI
jgi:hypothetical protein